MKTPAFARSIRSTTCLLIAALVLTGGEVSGQAQLFTFPDMNVNAIQDQPNAVGSTSYNISFVQIWSNPNADLPPTSVDFFSAQTDTVTAPISPGHYSFTAANHGGFTNYHDSNPRSLSQQLYVVFGSNPPPSPSVTSTFHGGVLDGTMTTINYDPALLTSLPLFSASTFNTFTGTSPSGTVAVDFSTFSVPGGATSSSRNFGLTHLVGGSNSTVAGLISQSIGAGVTSFSLDTSLTPLVAGDSYVFFLDDHYIASDGRQYTSSTHLLFTAVPEPSTYANIIVGALALAVVRLYRRRKAAA